MKPALAQVLNDQGPLLLDFDGPVCDIFSSYTNTRVSSELRAVHLQLGTPLPDSVIEESDPLEILRWTATLSKPALTYAVEDTLRAAELRAVSTAEPTPGAREVLSAADDSGRCVAIVSNNSAPAIAAYLDTHSLRKYVLHIVGREPYEPNKMKPDPYPVTRATRALRAKPETCILVGDSLADIISAQAAGVHVIGYANKPSKLDLFMQAGADAVVTTMSEIAVSLGRAARS